MYNWRMLSLAALTCLFASVQATYRPPHHMKHHQRQYGNMTARTSTTSSAISTSLTLPGTSSAANADVVSMSSLPINATMSHSESLSSIPAFLAAANSDNAALSVMSSVATTSTSTQLSHATFTYTVGSGTSASVITTTIVLTKTFTQTIDVYATQLPGGGAVPSPASMPPQAVAQVGGNAADAENQGASSAEPATTISISSTTTTTVTLFPVSTGAKAAATGGQCAPKVVTETIRSTITVTASPSKGAALAISSPTSSQLMSSMPGAAYALSSPGSVPASPRVSAGGFFGNGTIGNSTSPESRKPHCSSGLLDMSSGMAYASGWKQR